MLDLTALGPVIQEKYSPAYVKAHFENDRLFPLLRLPQKLPSSPGGRYANWIVKSAGLTAAVFSEGDAAPDTSSATYVRAYVSPVYVWAFLEITGIAVDALKGGVFDAVGDQAESAASALVDLLTTSFIGSTYGLTLGVDSSTSYAGITRSSYSWWQSTETDLSSATIGYTDVRDMIETMRDNDIGSRISAANGLILCPENQVSNFYDIAGSRGIHQLGPRDPAEGLSSQTFDGIPIAGMPDMDDNTILYLDLSSGIEAQEHRPFSVEFHSNSGDNKIYKCSAGVALKVLNPVKHGKHTSAAT